jgi:dCTP deaminase
MSILLKQEIIDHCDQGDIIINPYNPESVGPNSYDVTLSDKLATYRLGRSDRSGHSDRSDHSDQYLDVKKKNECQEIVIPDDGYVLQPGTLYLGSTNEVIGSDHFIPMYEGRSSMARLGIQSHISAGFGDIGFISRWTLEIIVVHPVKIYKNMRIGQVYFHRVNAIANYVGNRYYGKYKWQEGPQPSKSYDDVENRVTSGPTY